MISSEDVRRVTFEKSMRGYRCDDVDDYLKQVAESMEELSAKNDDLQKKLVVLAQRIDQYRAEEDTLRTTMINAQRLGENVIREAKQKAAEIIRAANMKAEDREQRARDDVELAKQEIVTLKSEADSFKRSLMEMYRKHINLISKLPEYKKPEEEEPAPAAAPAQTSSESVQTAPAEPAYTEPPVQPVQTAPVQESTAPQESRYYDAGEGTQPPVTEEREKVDTVEFAIAPHPEEPEEIPTPVQSAPQQEDLPFQPGAGLYDEPPAEKPARKTRKSTTGKRASRKTKAAAEPQEELASPAFDNFEGVDFDS
ncbi:DivIVA domain-containing protein [Subdoligranulum variabile]|uniref:DivIVA domain protein n=1 Tax=Subdoligranulum variabile DSM 15176 TaxID=411471 RepID=D1PL23_9FIRM|nr:DivIVA domain-containing protein [Subdoligranulum variabile]EFB76681.1 DivIVA domain protein [Subdoligranulum variabile DSM 15176]UWP68088.1 DivIVA domain-containing protein [Subdoligranulum variabile]